MQSCPSSHPPWIGPVEQGLNVEVQGVGLDEDDARKGHGHWIQEHAVLQLARLKRDARFAEEFLARPDHDAEDLRHAIFDFIAEADLFFHRGVLMVETWRKSSRCTIWNSDSVVHSYVTVPSRFVVIWIMVRFLFHLASAPARAM